MPYYAAIPKIGTGTYDDPWRPNVPDPSLDHTAVQLDPENFLVSWPGGTPGGPLPVGSLDFESDIMTSPLNPGHLNVINNKYGLNLQPGDTMADAAWQILESTIVPSFDGVKELWLGGELLNSEVV